MSTRTADLDVTFVEQLLTDPDLWAPTLPGETTEERAARRTAASDIADAYATASILNDGIDHVADLARRRTAELAAQARVDVARWLDEIRGAAA